ncbi:MAG: hypothetical protein ACFE9V_12340 [Candidatus Hodarchaeota archaeon]
MVKMRKNLKIALIITSILIVGGGATFGIIFAVTWGDYEYSNIYYYDPGVPPSGIEKVNFHSDVGSIRINYNETPTNYYIKLALDIQLKGAFVEGKSFSDFFKLIWLNESVPVTTFSLDRKSFLFPIIQKINISVILRTDIIYDIVAHTDTGSVGMIIPQHIRLNNTDLDCSTGSILLESDDNCVFDGILDMKSSTGSIVLYAKKVNFTQGLYAYTSTGSLLLNFTDCVIGDDLTGTVSTGSISIKSYNMIYTQNSQWDFETSTGSINVEILQYIDMGADITGSLKTSTGSIDLTYKDNQSNVGASFFGSWSTGSYLRSSSGGGFGSTGDNPFQSIDYGTATSSYTLSLTTGTGSIDVDGTST